MDKQFMTGVVLTEFERNIVDKFAERKGLGQRGFSAALRMIIREWNENQRVVITDKGRHALVEHPISDQSAKE